MWIGAVTPLERAIFIFRTQTDLSRAVLGKVSTGHVYHWLRNGVSEAVAIRIERSARDLVAGDEAARGRAEQVGGVPTVEDFFPSHEWTRDAEGQVTGFLVRVQPAEAANAPTERAA